MSEEQKKRHYSLRENYVWLLKQIWQLDKTIYLYFAAFTVISAIKPFIAIIFPRLLLQELMGPARPQQLALFLGSFFLIGATVYYLYAALSKADQTKIILFRISVLRKHQDKCLETDFQNTEDPLFLNASQIALDGLDGNGLGLGGILDRSFHLSGSLLAFVGYMAIVSRLSPYVLIYLLINVVLSFYFTLSAKEFETSQRDPLAKNNRRFLYLFRTMYDFSYGKELRLQGYRGNLAEKTKDQQKGLLAIRQSIYFKNFKSGLADTLLMLVREGIIYFYLIQQVISGQMSIPDFTMYFATVAAFANWFTEIVGHYAHIRAQNGYIDDIRNFRNQPDILASKNARPLPEGSYTIEFRNVSFHYPRSSSYVYKNLNLIIPAGQKLAIVGHNGAGKTTFVKLLCRLYDVNEGEILLNGINIKEFDKDEYYKKFSVVFQDIKPLAFSVAENVTLTQHEYDQNRLWKALEDANVADKVRKLPKQVNTPMLKILDPEGVEFSGGEAQKIAIARALYKQGDILIMDEPTAALDALAESQIYLNFDAAVHGRTAIYISHRLASTFFCDVIAMFEQGKLVEYGSHSELMLKGGKYADMFETQARYYKDNPEVAR